MIGFWCLLLSRLSAVSVADFVTLLRRSDRVEGTAMIVDIDPMRDFRRAVVICWCLLSTTLSLHSSVSAGQNSPYIYTPE